MSPLIHALQYYIFQAALKVFTSVHSFIQVCGSESLCNCRKDTSSLTTLPLRTMEEKTYRDHYHCTDHWNYFTDEPDIGPIILSLKQEPCGESFR